MAEKSLLYISKIFSQYFSINQVKFENSEDNIDFYTIYINTKPIFKVEFNNEYKMWFINLTLNNNLKFTSIWHNDLDKALHDVMDKLYFELEDAVKLIAKFYNN